MILNFGSPMITERRSYSSFNTVCFASPTAIPTEQLRIELDNLHKEAQDTTAKANNSRLRLMRLSEAAEKLRNQAAVSVRTGKDNDARDLLFQKKKVMQAMEKLKTRIEVFDELSAKLNKAISMKENLLMDNMAFDIEVTDQTETPTPVRIITPKEDNHDNSPEDNGHLSKPKYTEAEVEPEWYDNEEAYSNAKDAQAVEETSTYEHFVKHLDQQLNKVEVELETFLTFSNLNLERKAKPEYNRVQQMIEILDAVRHTRERIASILQTETTS